LFLVLASDGGEWSAAYTRDSLEILELRKVSSLPGMKAQFVSPTARGTVILPNDQCWLILNTFFIKEFYMFHIHALRNIHTHT
jgi:hypothetical protein